MSKAERRNIEQIYALKSQHDAEVAKQRGQCAIAAGASAGALYLSLASGYQGFEISLVALVFLATSYVFLTSVFARNRRVMYLAIDLRQHAVQNNTVDSERAATAAVSNWPKLPSLSLPRALAVFNVAILARVILSGTGFVGFQ